MGEMQGLLSRSMAYNNLLMFGLGGKIGMSSVLTLIKRQSQADRDRVGKLTAEVR